MRPLAALLLLAAWPCLHERTHAHAARNDIHDTLHSILGEHYKPVQRLITCARTLGTTKCLSALSVWRAERALEAYAHNQTNFNLTEDVKQFPWKKYDNTSEEELYSQLCDDTEKLLQYRSLRLNVIPGYELQLDSQRNGIMHVDFYKSNTVQTARGNMKKLHKMFYKIMPIIILPGLIMAAILPFVLPSLKLMTLATVMLNNMALMGAVFTLLRNNAFNDNYEHKVLYVNNGYANEKQLEEEHVHTNHDGILYADGKTIEPSQISYVDGEDFESIDDLSVHLNNNWLRMSNRPSVGNDLKFHNPLQGYAKI